MYHNSAFEKAREIVLSGKHRCHTCGHLLQVEGIGVKTMHGTPCIEVATHCDMPGHAVTFFHVTFEEAGIPDGF